MKRQEASPPPPDSSGMVSAMRSSNAPAHSAILPAYEQPVTARRFVSILFWSAVSTRPSMMRLTPQAQPAYAPAVLSGNKSQNGPFPRVGNWLASWPSPKLIDAMAPRSEEHTSELQSPYVISYAVF